MAVKHGLGWVPDIPDQRDFKFSAYMKTRALVPAKIDLRANCSDVEDQGALGSCTANALVGALEYLERKDNVQPFTDMSRLFIYYNERVIEHSVKEDAGAMLRDGIKTLNKQGACSEKTWPYAISKFADKPPKAAYTEAARNKISQYVRLSTLDDMRSCLAQGFPFVFGFAVYESFETAAVAKTGTVPMPKPSEKMLGGHAVLAVGYDDKKKRFIVRNSWGTGWGAKGYFTMPYAYLDNRDLSDDFWTIKK